MQVILDSVSDQERLEVALEEYNARKARDKHPAGSFDRARRWAPSDDERQACCARVRGPSRAYPYPLLVHCRTVEHVANLFDVDTRALRAASRRALPKPVRLGGTYYKAVLTWTEDGERRYSSIYDPAVHYVLGEKLTERVRRNHGGGHYVRATPDGALAAGREAVRTFVSLEPEQLANGRGLTVLEVECSGQYTVYGCACWECGEIALTSRAEASQDLLGHRKYAFSTVMPVREVSESTEEGAA